MRIVIQIMSLVLIANSCFSQEEDNIIRGSKQYELTNHLGNVLATISDRSMVAATAANGSSGIITELITATDYYAFGMQMPGRNFSSDKYRFGFNGKENDNDVKGDGNEQDYGMRIYDPRIAKFLSVDPLTKKYPWYTPYQFAGNKPTSFIDMDGAEEKATNDKKKESKTKEEPTSTPGSPLFITPPKLDKILTFKEEPGAEPLEGEKPEKADAGEKMEAVGNVADNTATMLNICKDQLPEAMRETSSLNIAAEKFETIGKVAVVGNIGVKVYNVVHAKPNSKEEKMAKEELDKTLVNALPGAVVTFVTTAAGVAAAPAFLIGLVVGGVAYVLMAPPPGISRPNDPYFYFQSSQKTQVPDIIQKNFGAPQKK